MRWPRECECVQVVWGQEAFPLETAAIFPLKSLVNPAEFICVSDLLSTERSSWWPLFYKLKSPFLGLLSTW